MSINVNLRLLSIRRQCGATPSRLSICEMITAHGFYVAANIHATGIRLSFGKNDLSRNRNRDTLHPNGGSLRSLGE